MNSFAIFRALLIYLQGESHPLYIAERQLAPPRTIIPVQRLGVGCLVFWLLIAFAVSSFLVSTGGRSFSFAIGTGAASLTPPALVIGWLVSLGWTVPLAMYSGYAISRERAARTWDTLRLAPYTADVILLSKAAASIRGVWAAALSIALTVTVLRMVIVSVLLVMAAGQLSPILVAVYIPVALIVIPIEMIQEIALSVTVGLAVGMNNLAPRMTSFVGAVSGFVIRLIQLAFIWWLMSHLVSTISPYVAVSATITGSTILLPAIPGLASLLLVLLLAVGREGLLRFLLAWTLQRTREG